MNTNKMKTPEDVEDSWGEPSLEDMREIAERYQQRGEAVPADVLKRIAALTPRVVHTPATRAQKVGVVLRPGYKLDAGSPDGQSRRRRPIRFTDQQIDIILAMKAEGAIPSEIVALLHTTPDGKHVTVEAVRARIKIGKGTQRGKRVWTLAEAMALVTPRGDHEGN